MPLNDAPNTSIRDLPAWLASGRKVEVDDCSGKPKVYRKPVCALSLVKETVASKTALSFRKKEQIPIFVQADA